MKKSIMGDFSPIIGVFYERFSYEELRNVGTGQKACIIHDSITRDVYKRQLGSCRPPEPAAPRHVPSAPSGKSGPGIKKCNI